jgi:hypothetical protein
MRSLPKYRIWIMKYQAQWEKIYCLY